MFIAKCSTPWIAIGHGIVLNWLIFAFLRHMRKQKSKGKRGSAEQLVTVLSDGEKKTDMRHIYMTMTAHVL
jgi:hypothetical protein